MPVEKDTSVVIIFTNFTTRFMTECMFVCHYGREACGSSVLFSVPVLKIIINNNNLFYIA